MSNDSEWNDEELVGLNELRPSRRVYGAAPQGTPEKKRAEQRPARANSRDASAQRSISQQRRQRPPQQRQPQSQGREPQPRELPPQRRQPQGQQPVRQQRARQEQQRRPRSPREDARPRSEDARPRSEDTFANDLAAANRPSPSAVASSGWRGALLKATGGVVNVGPSSQERSYAEMHRQLRRPVVDGTVAVFSRKGGVGKTTISAYLGLTLSAERGGRIVALDGDAEAGSLGWLLAPKSPSTLAALASANPIPSDYAHLRRYTAATPEGLEVIVGDPAEMGPISTTGLEAVAAQLARHYDISIFDTGAGVTRATGRVLVNSARTLLLVMSPSVDSVRAAERTLSWLDERPGEAANPNANVIAVINGIPASAKRGHVERIESHFKERCRAVVRIPWDQHLATGSSSVSLDLLSRPTREALVELAAVTVGTLARPQRNGRPRRRELASAGAARA